MFILRRVTKEGYENNVIIGKEYSIINRAWQSEKFNETMLNTRIKYGGLPNEDDIYSFIVYDNGNQVDWLYNSSKHYIMTENGSTFANISDK